MQVKFLFLFLFIFGLFSCENPIREQYRNSIEYQTIEIDSCYYLRTTAKYNDPLTHKGNCPNPIHKCNCK